MKPCYRERTNGVYFTRDQHRTDCADTNCRGCQPCPEPNHCTATRNCAWHIGDDELTCARCVATCRQNLRALPDLVAQMSYEALFVGVESEATNLAGPGADYATFRRRRELDRDWLYRNVPDQHLERALRTLLADDDEDHAYNVLGRWDMMIREDYDHPSDERVTVDNAADYLNRQLHRIAQDEDQDFPLFAREIRKCRQHHEAVLHDSRLQERGAPCRACPSPAPRLQLEHAHWCDDPTCERIHYLDDSGDRWVCPADRDHWWSVEDYRRWVYADAHEGRDTQAS